MRAFFLTIGLVLASCSATFADAASDCTQYKDPDFSLRSCTLIIEGQASGNKVVAYVHRCQAYVSKNDYDRGIGDCNQAIQLDPQVAYTYHERAMAHQVTPDASFRLARRSHNGARTKAIGGQGTAIASMLYLPSLVIFRTQLFFVDLRTRLEERRCTRTSSRGRCRKHLYRNQTIAPSPRRS